MKEQPNDPFSVMAEGAVQLHELFLSLVSSGFTEAQALRLVGEFMAASGRQS